MSPLELPGRSFGYLPDRRNITCEHCGGSFPDFLLNEGKKDKAKGVIRLKCPLCGYKLEVIDTSKPLFGKKDKGKQKGEKKQKKAKKK